MTSLYLSICWRLTAVSMLQLIPLDRLVQPLIMFQLPINFQSKESIDPKQRAAKKRNKKQTQGRNKALKTVIDLRDLDLFNSVQ